MPYPCLGAFILFCSSLSAVAAERTWDFDLKAPGDYEVHVKHTIKSAEVPRGAEATYAFQTAEKTIKRSHPLYTPDMDHPVVMLISEVTRPQTARVVISGLPAPLLQQTRVYVIDGNSRYPYEWFDPGQSIELKAAEDVRDLLTQPEEKIDLARAKLAIDKLIDPAIDVNAGMKRIDAMTAEIRNMPDFGSKHTTRLMALKRYIYGSGEWNNHHPFSYDLDDPLGTKLSNKFLVNYLDSRKGNCVSMPFLFVILGQRLGLDVTAATAPLHVLVKFRDETGTWINLETTSGANPARDVWYREQMPMTDKSIADGVYLRPLTRKETVATMAMTLAEYYFEKQEFEKAIAISDLTLEFYPRNVEAMVRKGSAYYRLLGKYYFEKYRSPQEIPLRARGHFEYLSRGNHEWFSKAEALGWRQPSREDDEKYIRKVSQQRNKIP